VRFSELPILPVLLACACACGGSAPIPAEELLMRIEAQGEVELGRGFPLTVMRVWSRELTPAVWNDASLAPLKLKLLETTRREDGRRIEETRRYEGFAVTLGDISIPAPELRAVAGPGGAERVASADPIEIKVNAALPATDDSEPELPGEAPTRSLLWIYGIAGALALAVVALRVHRKRTPAPPPPAPPTEAAPSPAALALAQLTTAEVLEIPDVLRRYMAARFGIRTAESSTEELLRNPAIAQRDQLALALRPCDLAKFAGVHPTGQSTAATRASAARYVEATA
jgi:hypothetical protein